MSNQLSDDRRLLQSITVTNMLSFDQSTSTLPLENLNVLIGPNGSGKSNLLEVVSLLRNTPTDLRHAIRQGGGVSEWIWKGQPETPAAIDVVVANPKGRQPLRHTLAFRSVQQAFRIEDERIENEKVYAGEVTPHFFYHFQGGNPVVNTVDRKERGLSRESIDTELSILAQRRDPDIYPEITYLASVYDRIRLYREWEFGRNTVFRLPQKADLRNDRLEEDFSNLGLYLSKLGRYPDVKRALLEHLRDLYDGLTDFDVFIEGGTVQVFFTEGKFNIPATRLSDGSIRYLCLLAILLDPEPPPLIGIEEPELGLHPDLLPKVADLLLEASSRTQLIVTTHSDILIDALSDHPESVVVCEKAEGHTTMRRLDSADLKPWLEKYRLGQLWTKGELGGTRW